MLITGVRRDGVFPEEGQLQDNVKIERPAVVLDFIVARTIEVGDSTDEEPVITSSLFGKNIVLIGRNVTVVGNVQSNGKVVIKDGSKVLGNVVAREAEIGSEVNVLGNIITESHVALGRRSKVGGYVVSIRGTITTEDEVEVFDLFGDSELILGQDVHAMDYALFGGSGGVRARGGVILGEYKVEDPKDLDFRGSLNLLTILIPNQYNPKNALKYLRDNLNSIVDIKTYLQKHNVDIQRLERDFQLKPFEDMLKRMAKEITKNLSMAGPTITVTNAEGPVTITVGENNVVSVNAGESDKHQTVNLVELFQKARESILKGDLPAAYSAVAAITEAIPEGKPVPGELDEFVDAIRSRIREGIAPSEEIKEVLVSLLDTAYNRMLKL